MRPPTPSPFPGLAALALVASIAAQAPTTPLPADRATGADTVTVEQCKFWLGTLASPEFEGRGTGQEGFRKAAEWMRDRFKQLGLEPAGDDGTYFQAVPWTTTKIDAEKTFVQFTTKQGERIRVPHERMQGQASQDSSADGPALLVVLPPGNAAVGQRAEPHPLIANLDVKDKVVLLHVQQAEGAENPAIARFRAVNTLREREAAAVVVLVAGDVGGGLSGRAGAGRGAGNRAVRGARVSLAPVEIGGEDGKKLLATCQLSLDKAGVFDLQATAEVSVKVDSAQAPVWNVLGIMRGSDAKLAAEYVVIGSHLDHLGRRGREYFPGADDDASGSTGVLAVASMFAANPVKPKRSVLFVTFCGEEAGLIGSTYFADHSPIPLTAIVGELQMDMIGRNEEDEDEQAKDNLNTLHLVGTEKLSRDMHALCVSKNSTAGFTIEWDEEDVFFRSDHAAFAKKGIPIAFFFTGFHPDYHRPSDTPDKIDYDKLLRVARYVYDIGFELATQDGRPLIDTDLWEKNRGRLRGLDTPSAPMRTK